ncbi:MAG TPA: hypothetical protein VNQ76_05150 [Planctomicrobium sp.]|nr:hypothetical protein [Planctomicrobium sp.]
MPDLPFSAQNEQELRILADPEFLAGLDHGRPRPGHPEGAVKWHIADVLGNVDRWYRQTDFYSPLRLIALIHDTFKYQVDPTRPKTGANHHGHYAHQFAEKYIDDESTLDVIELHDEAYNAWQKGARDHQWVKAETRAKQLLERLGPTLPLYSAFFRCDNATGDKAPEPMEWFHKILEKDIGR